MILKSKIDEVKSDMVIGLHFDDVHTLKVVIVVGGVVGRRQAAALTAEDPAARPHKLGVATSETAAVVNITAAEAAATADAASTPVVYDHVGSPEPAAGGRAIGGEPYRHSISAGHLYWRERSAAELLPGIIDVIETHLHAVPAAGVLVLDIHVEESQLDCRTGETLKS